ncbi:MAG: tetratricopeptide repeat protein [candidate division Zixibacteria bacterium]|nr:tetratricopeptide repeat protein [candidate division Zixibacteria bacterium]
MRKFIFVWASILILLSSLSVGSQTVSQDTSQIAEEILKQKGQIDSLRMEFEKVKKDGYEKAIESANRSISIATFVIGFVALLVGILGILGYFRIRETKADYKETKAELMRRFEEDLEKVKEYKEDIKEIYQDIKEKRKFVDEETENFKKRIKVLQKEVPSDFSKEISELIEKDSKTAIEEYEKVMNRIFDEGIYLTMAYNYYVEKKYEESIGELRKVVTLNPQRYDAYFNWGVALGKLGRHEEAIEKYRKATELKPDYVDAYLNWGVALGELGRYEEEIEKYRKAIEVKPDYAKAYYNWGVALGELGRYEEEIEKYRKAIEVKPDYVDAYSNWGFALIKLSRYGEAIDKCKRGIELKPDFASAWYNMACAYSLLKKKEKALESLKRAVELNLKYKEDAKKDEDFKNLWEDEDFKKLVE